MGKIRAMRVPEFKRIGKSAFVRKFINKPLEPMADQVYDYLLKVYKEKYGMFVLGPEFRNLFAHLTHFGCVLELVEDIHNNSWMKEGYHLENGETLNNFRRGADDALLREIASLSLTTDKIWFSSAGRKDLDPILDKWNALLGLVPNVHNVDYDENEVMTDEYITNLPATLMTIWDGIEKLATQAREVYINGLIKLVKESNITASNSLYRDIYDCLRMADLIPEEQLHLHDSSTSRYVRENYIKTKYQRLIILTLE